MLFLQHDRMLRFLGRSPRSRFHGLRLLQRIRLRLQRVGLGAQLLSVLRIAGHVLEARLGAQILRLPAQLVRGLALRLLPRVMPAEVKHQLAAPVAHLVDRVAGGLLRVAHALVDGLAHALERAAGGVVHVAHELLRLRHDALAKALQRRERLVERFAQVKLPVARLRFGLLFVSRFFLLCCLLRLFLRGVRRGFGRGLLLRGLAVFAVHPGEQLADVLQRRGDLGKGFLFRLAARHRVLVAGLRVGQQLVAQRQVLRRHLHLGKDLVNHAANALVHCSASSMPISREITARYLRQSDLFSSYNVRPASVRW